MNKTLSEHRLRAALSNLNKAKREGSFTVVDIERESIEKGVVVGKPNLLQEDKAKFTDRQEEFIVTKEIHGGFYELTYAFDLVEVTAIKATSEMEALADELTIELFPYQEDGEYSAKNSEVLTGEVFSVAGIFYVYFPYDWLTEERNDEQSFYLRISDGEGNIYKEDYFLFVPYTP
jgi:hypothetical protein